MKFFILLLGVMLSQSVCAASGVEVFGIKLGADLPSFPVCKMWALGESDKISETCFRANEIIANPRSWKGGSNAGGCEEYQILLPTRDIPGYLNFNRSAFSDITISVIDGKVENITLFTNGASSQDEALAALVKKFGKPKQNKEVVLQNSFGAKRLGYSAIWVKGDTTVLFDGITYDINNGLIDISTKKYLVRKKEWVTKEKGKDL